MRSPMAPLRRKRSLARTTIGDGRDVLLSLVRAPDDSQTAVGTVLAGLAAIPRSGRTPVTPSFASLRSAVFTVCAAALATFFSVERAQAGGRLTVAMTAGDIPVTTGNPDQGFEGYRFVGYNLYDGLMLWDLSKADKPSEIRPGLATSCESDPQDRKRWIVHLRRGVR